jgi:hypothetical protein
MSKRTLRRAAERQARKADRQQQLAAQAAVASHPTVQVEQLIELNREAQASGQNFETHNLNTATEPLRAVAATAAAVPATLFAELQASAAQIAANRENANFSSGPTTAEGEAASSQNRRTHGLVGRFTLLPSEIRAAYEDLAHSTYEEHHPETDTEQRLVDAMIQHYWLMQRAINLQGELLARAADPVDVDPKRLSLFVRYQATHERSYYRAMRELQNLRKEKRKSEIGFESQNRREEAHEASVRLATARARSLEIDTDCRQAMEVPLPGNMPLSFEELTKACSNAIATTIYLKGAEAAASAK